MVDVAAGVELVRGLKRDELRDVLLLIGVVNLLLQIVQIGHVPVRCTICSLDFRLLHNSH